MADIYILNGKRLRKHRRLAKLSQTALARKLHLRSTAMISRWESGETMPSLENAMKLSKMYKVFLNDLFWEFDQKYSNEFYPPNKKPKGRDP